MSTLPSTPTIPAGAKPSPRATLTWQVVEQLRASWHPGKDTHHVGTRRLAKQYGVARQTIQAVLKGRSWRKRPWSASHHCLTCGKVPTSKPNSNCPQEHIDFYQRVKERSKLSQRRLFEEVLRAYGAKCACCGFDDLNRKLLGRSFLSLDHVNGGGRRDYLSKAGPSAVYRRVKREGFPSDYRVLCLGCNISMEPGAEKCLLHQ